MTLAWVFITTTKRWKEIMLLWIYINSLLKLLHIFLKNKQKLPGVRTFVVELKKML